MAEIKKTKKMAKKAVSKPIKTSKSSEVKTSENSRAFAIIETGGKQYRVAVGDTIKIEKVCIYTEGGKVGEIKQGDPVVFDKVLLIDNGADSTDIGTPYIEGAKVSGTLVEIGRNPKVVVIKYKQKSRYFKRNGHRQPFYKVKIDKIS